MSVLEFGILEIGEIGCDQTTFLFLNIDILHDSLSFEFIEGEIPLGVMGLEDELIVLDDEEGPHASPRVCVDFDLFLNDVPHNRHLIRDQTLRTSSLQ